MQDRIVPVLRIFDEAKAYRHAKPSVEEMPWKTREMGIRDPFGNQLVYVETL